MSSPTSALAEALALTNEARCVTTARQPYQIVHCNHAWARVTGWKFADAVGKSASILQGPGTQQQSLDILRDALNAASPAAVTVQLVNYTFRGVPFTNTLRISPIRNRNGMVTNFSATIESSPCFDPTVEPLGMTVPRQNAERRAASETESTISTYSEESVKRQATGRLRRAARHMDLSSALCFAEDAVVLAEVAEPHRILHVNKAWSDMCGFTMEEVEGASCAILQGAETDGAALDEMMRSVRRGEASSATVYSYKKGGIRFLNQVQFTPVWDGPRIALLMGILHEVDTPDALQAIEPLNVDAG